MDSSAVAAAAAAGMDSPIPEGLGLTAEEEALWMSR